MRSAVVGLLIALVLFAVAAALWSEAGAARRVADAHLRFATLNYNHDDGIDEAASVLSRVHLPIRSVTADVPEHRAKLAYWRSEYRDLTATGPGSGSNRNDSVADPVVMLVAANAAFRATMMEPADKATTVERLDRVIQAYGDVLRAQPSNSDASYNYEYVARFRDNYAKITCTAGRAGRRRISRCSSSAP
jgi:hypothetical protein